MKKLVILGGKESGVGAALLGKKQGWEVFLSDKGKIEPKYREVLEREQIAFEENDHTEAKILQADCVIKSPGIPDDAPLIQALLAKKIEVISEIEFAVRYSKGKIIAITGSNGKTTTTSFIYHLLKNDGFDVAVVGNIGVSFAGAVAERDREYYVLEISSFQLDGCVSFHPHIAVLLNITPDHLDRYANNFENYIASKFLITKNQTPEDYFIYDADDPVMEQWFQTNEIKAQKIPFSLEKTFDKGAFCREDEIIININNFLKMNTENLKIKGKHNVKNAMAGLSAAALLKARKENVEASAASFAGISHRLEFVRKLDEVTYINDSKATNVNSVYYALDAIKDSKIVWIVGGKDKANDYTPLVPYVSEKVKAIVFLGVDKISYMKVSTTFKHLNKKMEEYQSMEEAVKAAQALAEPGDTVLLAPACASFDLFKGFDERGDLFKKAVNAL